MKFTYIVSALMAILLTACASTQQTADTTDSATSVSSKHTFHGKVMAIDMSVSTVTVQVAEGSVMTMIVNSDTQFKYPGGSKSLNDFKVGDEVSGSVMMDNSGRMVALLMKPYNSKQ
jgi:hypothetical protein